MLITVLYVLTAIAALYVVFTLIAGAASMGKKDLESRERSNKWMQRRVVGQAAAVLLLILTLYIKSRGT